MRFILRVWRFEGLNSSLWEDTEVFSLLALLLYPSVFNRCKLYASTGLQVSTKYVDISKFKKKDDKRTDRRCIVCSYANIQLYLNMNLYLEFVVLYAWGGSCMFTLYSLFNISYSHFFKSSHCNLRILSCYNVSQM